MINNLNKTRKISILGFLIALSYIGSLVKIQGSIALDSLPGYFAALFLGPIEGFLVAGLGHILTALTSGFPLTIPMHIIVALQMSIYGYLFGYLYMKFNKIVTITVTIILNGPISALLSVPISSILKLPLSGWNLFNIIIIPLTIASIVNIVLAYLLFKLVKKRYTYESSKI